MYTILENARIVIALLKKHNIRHIVLSPGGSNIPIVQGVQDDPFFKCYSVVDERSAMYFAIGLWHETGEPIATSCTSAQATRNYVPGLTEAFYKHAPILAITMSKHPRYLGQEYMQCPIQTSLPKDAVKKSFSIPRINDDNDRALCIRMTNEAILELTHHSYGPVQLNIEELDNETWRFDDKLQLPSVRFIQRLYSKNNIEENLSGKRILLLIGEHRVFTKEQIKAVESFSAKYNVFIYATHIANYHGKYSLNGNPCISFISQSIFNEQFLPDILITIGGITGDYSIYSKLFGAPNGSFEHWRINPDGDVVDTYGKLTRVYQMSIADFFIENEEECNNHSYFNVWKTALDNIILNTEIPLSNLFVAQQLHDKIPESSRMNFAILNSLRSWGYFSLHNSIVCSSNVAAFGIDGCLSVLLGQSMETEQLTFLVTGDLAFFYDMNALGIRHNKKNLRILLINNNGGMEFKFTNLVNKTNVNNFIAANDHFKNAKGWAETCGFRYLYANSKKDYYAYQDEFIRESDQPILFEIFTTPENEKLAAELIAKPNVQNKTSDEIKDTIKKSIVNIIGLDNAKQLKKLLK